MQYNEEGFFSIRLQQIWAVIIQLIYFHRSCLYNITVISHAWEWEDNSCLFYTLFSVQKIRAWIRWVWEGWRKWGTELGIFCDRDVSVRLKESVELCRKITDDEVVSGG